MKLLQVDSSSRASSVTRRLAAKFREEWKKSHPDGEVIRRDLSATALPLITDDWLATRLEESKLTPAQRSYLSTSDELIEELQAADGSSLARRCTTSRSRRHLKHGSIRLCGSGRRLATVQTARKAFSQERKLSSSLLAGVPMKRALRGKLSIFRNPTSATFWVLSD